MKKFNVIFVLLSAGMFVLIMTSLNNELPESYAYSEAVPIIVSESELELVPTVIQSLNDVPKPLVNYDYFELLVNVVKDHRVQRLVSLDTFLFKAKEVKTVILDTRSKEMYDLKHVKGAVHLNFSDFTQQNLANLFDSINGKNTQILIYCNNNFFNPFNIPPQDKAFMSKTVQIRPEFETSFNNGLKDQNKKQTLALNIPTYINLYGYGYQNVFELHEFVSVQDPRILFEGTFDDE